MNSSPTSKIWLDTRRPLSNSEFPIKLRITYQRKSRDYSLGKSATIKDFEKITGQKPRGEFKELSIFLNLAEKRAVDIIKEMNEFNFHSFKKAFFDQKSSPGNVYDAYRKKIERLYEQDRVGTASSYESSLASLKGFKSKLQFEEVDIQFLESYEKYMLKNGKSTTTVGIYLRPLQAIFNEAIDNDYVNSKLYPFGKYKYQIPKGVTTKKALKLDEIARIIKHKPITKSEERARDLWVFSYLCNGINVKDIARLKYENIHDDKITFIRAKTERKTRSNPKPIVVTLFTEIDAIIKKWGTKPRKSNNYVFDILKKGQTAIEQKRNEKQAVKTINHYMKRIGEACKIKQKITTYTARHSFSTILKQSGVSIEFISESLGHSDLKVTENYLDGFEDKTKLEYSKKLLDFK